MSAFGDSTMIPGLLDMLHEHFRYAEALDHGWDWYFQVIGQARDAKNASEAGR